MQTFTKCISYKKTELKMFCRLDTLNSSVSMTSLCFFCFFSNLETIVGSSLSLPGTVTDGDGSKDLTEQDV